MTGYPASDERADTAFLVGSRYARDLVVDALPTVLDAHFPADDFRCKCGEDCFGGSAAYSWRLWLAHAQAELASASRGSAA